MKTLTRADIAEAVYREIGLPRSESAGLVEQILQEMSDRLVKHETVKICSFGRLSVSRKKQRIGRNPRTSEEIPIKPRSVLLFRASHLLKSKINKA